MVVIKKLVFALPFILFLCGFSLTLSSFLRNPGSILSPGLETMIQTAVLTALTLLAGLSFAVFVTLAMEWKYILPTIFAAGISLLLLLPAPFNFAATGILLASLTLISFLLERKLKNYLTFQPSTLLSPQIKQVATLLIVLASLIFYFSADQNIRQEGFKIPESLIDMSLQFIPKEQLTISDTSSNLPTISPQQISLLEQNPEALKQFGIDPKVLEGFKQSSQPKGQLSPEDLIKPMIRSQMQNLISPYQQYIPITLAIILFFTLQAASSLLSLLLSPLLSLIFLILERTGFTRYEVEMREVKKLVV